VDPNVVLSWAPGKDALSHDVYIGTNYDDVNDANTLSESMKLSTQIYIKVMSGASQQGLSLSLTLSAGGCLTKAKAP
jgi:hypothetical protein